MTTPATHALSFGATLCNLLVAREQAPVLSAAVTPAVVPPALPIDLGAQLAREIGRLGTIQESMGGFRIKTDKPLAFPFGKILSALASRQFKVTVSQSNSMLVIEARP